MDQYWIDFATDTNLKEELESIIAGIGNSKFSQMLQNMFNKKVRFS